MADLHTLSSYRGDGRLVTAPAVAQALRTLGGAAHRDLIVDLLLGALPASAARPVLAQEVDRVLAENAGDGQLFARMFGPDSRRWMLKTPDALAKPSAVAGSLTRRRRPLRSVAPAAEPR